MDEVIDDSWMYLRVRAGQYAMALADIAAAIAQDNWYRLNDFAQVLLRVMVDLSTVVVWTRGLARRRGRLTVGGVSSRCWHQHVSSARLATATSSCWC